MPRNETVLNLNNDKGEPLLGYPEPWLDPQTMQDMDLKDLLTILMKQLVMPDMNRKVTRAGQFTHYGPRDQPSIPQERMGGIQAISQMLQSMSGEDLQRELVDKKSDLEKELMGMKYEGERGLQEPRLLSESARHGNEMAMRRDVANIQADTYRDRAESVDRKNAMVQIRQFMDTAVRAANAENKEGAKKAMAMAQRVAEDAGIPWGDVMADLGVTAGATASGDGSAGGDDGFSPPIDRSNQEGNEFGAFGSKNRRIIKDKTYGGNLRGRDPASVEPAGPPDPNGLPPDMMALLEEIMRQRGGF